MPETFSDLFQDAATGNPDDTLSGLLGAPSTAEPEAGIQGYDDLAAGTAMQDSMLGEAKATAPTLPADFMSSFNQPAYPLSAGEAVVEAGKRGLTIQYSPGLFDDLDNNAHAAAQAFIASAGGSMHNVDDPVYERLVAAYRWVLTSAQSSLADEEKTTVLKSAADQAFSIAANQGLGRLTDLDARLEDPTIGALERNRLEQEREDLRKAVAETQSWRSRVAAGDASAISNVRTFMRSAINREKAESAQDSLAVRQLNSVLIPGNPTGATPDDGVGVRYQRGTAGAGMQRALTTILSSADTPRGAEQVLKLATQGALQRVRASRFGVTPEDVNAQGINAMLFKTYPDLVKDIIVQSRTEMEEGTPATFQQTGRTFDAPAGVVSAALANIKTAQEQLAEFDPQKLPVGLDPVTRAIYEEKAKAGRAIGSLLFGAFELSGRAFSAASHARRQVTETMGWTLPAWEMQPIDHEAIRAGAEAGEVNLGTAMRYAGAEDDWSAGWALAAEHLSSGLAEAADFVSWQATGEGISAAKATNHLGIGKMIAEKIQDLPAGALTPDTMRTVLRAVKSELIDANQRITDIRKTGKQYWADATRAQREGSFLEQLYTTTKAAVYQTTFQDTAELLYLMADDPTRAPVIGALTLAGNEVGGRVMGNVHDAVNRGFAKMTERGRLRRAMKDHAYFDPQGNESLARAFREHGVDGLTDAKTRAAADIAQKLADEGYAELNDAARLTTPDRDAFHAARRRKVRELDKLVKSTGAAPVDVLDAMGMPQQLIQDITNPVKTQFLNDIVSGVMDKLHLRGHKLTPFAQSRGASNVFRKINDMLDAGEDLATINQITAPVVGTEEGYRNWFRAAKDKFGIGSRTDWEKVSLSAAAGRWAQEALPAVTALRDYNIIMQGRQKDLLDLAMRRLDADEGLLLTYPNLEPGIVKQGRRVNRARELLRTASEEVQARGWREEVKLSQHEALLDTLSFTDLRMWWETSQGPSGRHQLWLTMAKRSSDGVLDPPRQFFDYLREVEQIEEAALSGRLRGKERKKALAFVKEQKRSLVRSVFDREIPEKFLSIDDKPSVFNTEWVKRTERKRAGLERQIENTADPVQRQALQERLDRMPKVVKQDLPVQLQEASDLAATIAADQFDAVAPKTAAWDFTRPTEVAEFMRQKAIAMRGKIAQRMMTVQNFFEEYHALSPVLREQFDDMLGKAGSGDFKSWGDFFDKNPDLRARFGEGTPLENMGYALEKLEGVRADLLELQHRTGAMTDEVYEHMARPYSPHRFSADEYPKMIGRAARNKMQKQIKEGRLDFGVESTDENIFELQRDAYHTRLLIQQSGSRWIDKKFPSRIAAHRYVLDHYGSNQIYDARGKAMGRVRPLSTVPGVEGRTGLGDKYVVLDPLGEQHMADLGLIGRGPALAKSTIELMRNGATWQIHKSLDRPGFTMTERDWAIAQNSPAGRKQTQGFVRLKVPDSPIFKPLAGKYIHKDALRTIQQALQMHKVADDMMREFTESAISDVPGFAAGASKIAGKIILGGSDMIRQLIGTQAIERGARTHHMNRITDAQVFARGAMGPGYLTSEAGKLAQRRARQFLLGREGGDGGILESFNGTKSLAKELASLRKTDPQLAEWIDDAIGVGMLGDSLLGSNPISAEAHKAMAHAMFGESAEGMFYKTSPAAAAAFKKRQLRLEQVTHLTDKLTRQLEGMTTNEAGREQVQKTLVRLTGEKYALEAAIDLEPSRLGRRFIDSLGWLAGTKVKRGTFDEIRNYTHHLYQREGNIHRLGGYLYMRERGYSHEYATNRIRTYMQDYSNIRGFAQLLRKVPVANPILSFPMEMLRIQSNLAKSAPGFLLGWLSIAPVLSMPALLSAGIDPAEYYKAQGRGNMLDAVVHATSTLVTPSLTGDGVDEWQAPQLGAVQMLRRSTGMVGQWTHELEASTSALDNAAGAGLRVAGQFLGNPITDAIYTTWSRRDAMSHEKIGDGGILSAGAEATGELSRLLVPSTSPWFGTFGRTNLDNLRYPPRPGTGQIEPPLGRLMYSLIGIKHRGSALDYVDAVAGRPMAYSARLLLDAMNIASLDDMPIPRDLPTGRSINDEDLALWIYYANRKNGMYPEGFGKGPLSQFEDDLELFSSMQAHGEKTGDKALKSWAERSLADIRGEMKEALAEHPQFKVIGVPDDVLDREGEKFMKKHAKRADFGEQFAGADLIHQTTSLLGMSAAGIKDDVILHLARRAIFQTRNSTELTGWSDPAAIKVAIRHLDEHMADHDERMTGTQALNWLRHTLQTQLPDAERKNAVRIWQDENNRDAALKWKALKHGDQEGDFDIK